MIENKKDPEELTPTEEDVCKALNEEELTEEEAAAEEKRKKRDQAIISTAVDGVLTFFQVW